MKIIGICANCKSCGRTWEKTAEDVITNIRYYCCSKDNIIYKVLNDRDGKQGKRASEYFDREVANGSYGEVRASHTCDKHIFKSIIIANKTRSPRSVRKL